MDLELKANKEIEEFQMTVAYQWLYKYKTAKILNIQMGVDSCQEVAKIHKLVLTKIIIYKQPLVLQLKNNLTLILVLTLTKLIQPRRVMNPLLALVTLKEERTTCVQVKTERTAVLTLVLRGKLRAPLQQPQLLPVSQRLE
jgi:hypothetical protein